ncbi:tail assembly protein [Gallibacterium anatis]|uniref:Tail protein n=1 Tax=Gallibacterium anatis 12656/12 TaxID=1195244 RepID=U1IAT8_9PAST|nr:tail assembly protein [Gallibacterium anatis]ERF79444.1 tail protein [Gallibacterium anatis 12656/12]KGQ27328.1 tail protein [Gallibacterium anatis]KGQ46793.1 tail protein [Gallibacterium anatis]KGQ49336.1 tail protein [Gallibacterium anatis]
MATIKLYGNLKRFGTAIDLAVEDTAEAIRALCCQLVGFRQALQQGYYKVRIGKHLVTTASLEKDMLYKLNDNAVVHLTPVIKGAKSGGIFSAVLGVALIGLAFWNPLGWAAVGGTGLLAGAAQMPLMLGAAMLLGGISQMLAPQPKMGSVGTEQEKKQSTSFSNLGNLSAQGRPVPLAYGEILTGSLIISQGIETYNVDEEMKKKTEPKKGLFRKG